MLLCNRVLVRRIIATVVFVDGTLLIVYNVVRILSIIRGLGVDCMSELSLLHPNPSLTNSRVDQTQATNTCLPNSCPNSRQLSGSGVLQYAHTRI